MPQKKYYRKKKGYGKKRAYRKKFRSTVGMGGGGKRFFKLRTVIDLTSTAGGVIDQVVSNNPSGFGDWASVVALFDEYRFCAVKLKYIPTEPNDTFVTQAFYPFYIVPDNNDVNTIGSVANALNVESCRVKNMFRPWKYYYKWQKASSTGSSEVVIKGGYRDVSATAGYQSVKMYGTGFGITKTLGQLIITGYIVARNRK